MADFPMPGDAPRRYAELEQAYVEERWPSVRGNGQDLLDALEESDDPEALALANRVRVLMGHAHLYGLGEPDVAEDYYRAVLASNAESQLRQIAAEGLQQCQRPAGAAPEATAGADQAASAAPVVQESQAPVEAAAVAVRTEQASGDDPFQAALNAAATAAAATPATTKAAMPWLADLAADSPLPAQPPAPLETGANPFALPATAADPGALAPRLEVEVVEEPELLEVAQADPGLAEELELELSRIRERRRRDDADPFAAAIAAATAEVAAQEPERDEEPGVEPLELAATAEEQVEQSPDLSLEDPDLVAGLLRVVIRG